MNFYELEDRPAADVVNSVQNLGFETYDIRWPGAVGWATNKFGLGHKAPRCAFAEIVRWIAADLADNPRVMGAVGNSGGAGHLGWGLAVYGLDELLDVVVLTGGPPSADTTHQCFSAFWDGMDEFLGWPDGGNFCSRGSGPEWVSDWLQAESIVSTFPGDLRDYEYLKTKVAFIHGEQDTPRMVRARVYFEAITTDKTWDILPGVGHVVSGYSPGAAEIQNRLLSGLTAASANNQ